jgi:hypothetical protein
MNTPPPSNFPEPPSFEFVQEKLKTLFNVIQEAVAEGTLHVQEYSQWQAELIDPALAPNLVRHKAKKFLVSRGQDAKDDEEEFGFETEHIPNNGICTNVSGFRVRVLKSSDEGSVPLPGESLTRKNFYNQSQALLDFAELRNGNEHVQPTWGLIVHWTVDADYNLLRLSAALPTGLTKNDNGKPLVECAFDEPLWTRPYPNVIPIDEVPPVTNLDVEGLQIDEEPGEKTGEGPTGE